MFIYEFRLSQVPGNFDRLDSTALSTGQDRPTRVWESVQEKSVTRDAWAGWERMACLLLSSAETDRFNKLIIAVA